MERQGLPWGVVFGILKDSLPQSMQDREELASSLVRDAVIAVVGPENETWHTERKVAKSTGHESTWIVPGPGLA